MSEQIIKRLTVFIMARMLETITSGGLKILWMDVSQGRVMFEMDPNNQQVSEILKVAEAV